MIIEEAFQAVADTLAPVITGVRVLFYKLADLVLDCLESVHDDINWQILKHNLCKGSKRYSFGPELQVKRERAFSIRERILWDIRRKTYR